MTLYSLKAVEKTLDNYINKGGEVLEVEEGCLGYGTTICLGEGLKTTIVKEVYLNEWSSSHTIRIYNKMPKKYAKMVAKYYNN